MITKHWICGAAYCAVLAAQAVAQDRFSVAFRDPSRPGSLSVDLMNTRVTVRAYEGRDVQIEASGAVNGRNGRNDRGVPPGMHRIDSPARGVNVEESNNAVRITGGASFGGSLTIQVPAQTSVRLKSLNGKLTVEGITGELDLDTLNGSIEVIDASGPVLAHTLNGRIDASLTRLPGSMPLSFSTMNAPIDLKLPSDVKTKLKMKTSHGEIYTDFDVQLEAGSIVSNGGNNGGRYRFRVDRTINGTINGGGPEIQITTYNGRITIGKK